MVEHANLSFVAILAHLGEMAAEDVAAERVCLLIMKYLDE